LAQPLNIALDGMEALIIIAHLWAKIMSRTRSTSFGASPEVGLAFSVAIQSPMLIRPSGAGILTVPWEAHKVQI
jgi:hypothetical protein